MRANPLRPGHAVWKRCVATLLSFQSPGTEHEPQGNCWDNAVAESFFSSLKKERIKKHIYKNRQLALTDVSDYIETFYNRSRRHSHLGGMSPEGFEAVHNPRRRSVH